jgi:hypothetical protein
MDINFIPHCFAYSLSCGSLDMEPSGFCISQNYSSGIKTLTLPQYLLPLRYDPALFNTPPFFALNGKICPGLLKSSGFVFGFIAT